jgi:hypothetical protein
MNRSKFLAMSIEAGRATPPAAQDDSVTSMAGSARSNLSSSM